MQFVVPLSSPAIAAVSGRAPKPVAVKSCPECAPGDAVASHVCLPAV